MIGGSYPGIPTETFDSVTDLKKEFLKVWNKYQKDCLEDKYPVVFAEGIAALNGEQLITY